MELVALAARQRPDPVVQSPLRQGGKRKRMRMRKVGVVALAQRLAVALWRYLEHGEIPAGATLKPFIV